MILPLPETIRLELARRIEDLVPYAQAWDRLTELAGKPPSVSHAWVSSFLEHQLQPLQSWFCILVFKGEDLVSVLPVIVSHTRRCGVKIRTLRTPQNPDTRFADIVFEPEDQLSVLAGIEALGAAAPNYVGLTLRGVAKSSPTLRILRILTKHFYIDCDRAGQESYICTNGSYEDFYDTLSANFKNNLRKASKKLKTLAGLRVIFLSAGGAKAADLGRFVGIEAASWKARMGTLIQSSPHLLSFYSALTRRLEERGWLEWQFLEADGKTIAGQLAIRVGRGLYIWKVAYDEDYAWCSPGHFLMEQTLQRAFASEDTDQVSLVTDLPYHNAWKPQKRQLYEIWICPKHAMSFWLYVLPKRARKCANDLLQASGKGNRGEGGFTNPR